MAAFVSGTFHGPRHGMECDEKITKKDTGEGLPKRDTVQ